MSDPTNPFAPLHPQNSMEWGAAVDAANLLLAIDIGRRMGLVDGMGHVNVERCEKILAEGRTRRITPRTPGPSPDSP